MSAKIVKAVKQAGVKNEICVRKNISKGELVVVDHPLIKHKITLLRNKDTRVNVFRDLVEEVSTLIGFEATSDFPLYEVEVETPVAKTFGFKIEGKKVAIVPILRAGVSMINGLLRLMPLAKIGHIGIYRNPDTFEPVEYFCKLPASISKRSVLLCDPMLATGGSAVAAIDMIKKRGAKNIKFLCIIAAPEGVKMLHEHHPDVKIFTATLDERLNDHAYIVPGLGDAGDRIYGTL
jgi:uracil phosphoribosyltransferase